LHNQIDETIWLVWDARSSGAVAASAFGGGFGGAVWALVRAADAETFRAKWGQGYEVRFPSAARHAEFFVTRAGPARLLGLKTKGHLGPGADADVTIYTNDADRAKMFATPRYVIKAGVLVVEEGQLRRAPAGRRLAVRPEYDASVTKHIERFFDQHATVAFANYGAEPVA
jgi:hypothetical protein